MGLVRRAAYIGYVMAKISKFVQVSMPTFSASFFRSALWGGVGPGAAVGCGAFGAGSGFRVGWRAAGGVWSLFFGASCCYWRSFHFGGGTGRWVIVLPG